MTDEEKTAGQKPKTGPGSRGGNPYEGLGDDFHVRVRGRYARLLSGELSVEDLDDDEVAQGRLKAADGTFRGRPPRIIPGELAQAMRREWLSRAESKLRAALMEVGLGGMIALAQDKSVDPSVRFRAQMAIIERTMGKVPDKIELRAEDPIESLFRDILNDPRGLAPAPKELSAAEREMLS